MDNSTAISVLFNPMIPYGAEGVLVRVIDKLIFCFLGIILESFFLVITPRMMRVRESEGNTGATDKSYQTVG